MLLPGARIPDNLDVLRLRLRGDSQHLFHVVRLDSQSVALDFFVELFWIDALRASEPAAVPQLLAAFDVCGD